MKYCGYNKEPEINIKGYDTDANEGYESIMNNICKVLGDKGDVLEKPPLIVMEMYPGVRETEIKEQLQKYIPDAKIYHSDAYFKDEEEVNKEVLPILTDDRVFGRINGLNFTDFLVEDKKKQLEKEIVDRKTTTIVYGIGASLLVNADILIYCDLARWEIQQRYRSGELGNWKGHNQDEEILRKYKRGYFLDWRMADKLKNELFETMDYYLDTNTKNEPKMITGEALRVGLTQVSQQPFRLVPYFDMGVWGGQWMKEVCGLDKEMQNYAWSFDGVPEENSIYLRYGQVRVEMPSINVVFYEPKALLGEKVYGRFGKEFPIRFDFLDTMGGQNLSLQVHPLTSYIQEKFGMHYTQDESYYVLDAKEGSEVYLGVKEGINPEEMIADLEAANRGEQSFDATKYINTFPATKHSHFLIPAGTTHCSGADTMILEISATPYIFTFKLWDWDRLGLDGLPRPVHIEHGKEVIQYHRDTKWVKENLVNHFEPIREEDGIKEEKTGLYESQFIETRRHWFTKKVHHTTDGSVNMINLVEGDAVLVESINGEFEPFKVHYAETFIIPEGIKEYTIKPYNSNEGKPCATLKAYVR